MHSKSSLTIEDAKVIAAAAEQEAQANGWRVTIVVVDNAGYPLLLHRLEGAPFQSIEIATQKARTAAFTRAPTKSLEEKILAGRVTLMALPGLLPIEGGEPVLLDKDCVGGVGVSGVQSSEDGQVARKGIAALNLKAS